MQNIKDFFGFRLIAFSICVLIVFGTFFRQEIYAFFFLPEGISIANSEICVMNESDKEPIIKVATDHGATITSLIFTGEKICVPSPMDAPSGVVIVSAQEDVPPFCEKKIEDEYKIILKAFNDDGTCEWGAR
ncbi:MAG: hypothetical protein AB8B49_03060 [Nitratireductor sp.]